MILVTGATGKVGTHVVSELLAKGQPTRAFVRDPQKAREVLGDEVELAVGDFERPETIDAALAGADRLYILTPSSPRLAEQERNLVEAATRARVRVVKHSWLVADEQARVETGRSHWQSERALERSGVPHTILQPTSFMDNFFFMINDGAFATAAEDGKIGLVDVRDVGAAAAAVLTEDGHDGKTYVLTGPEALSFDDAARIFTDVVGVEIRHVRVSQEDLRKAVAAATGSDWFGELLAALHGVDAAGEEAVVTNVVQELTGRPPRSLSDFARDHSGVLAGLAGVA
jgi:uncharacterized protein YbjT (DUF2867 family)